MSETDAQIIGEVSEWRYTLNSGVVIVLSERKRRVKQEELPPPDSLACHEGTEHGSAGFFVTKRTIRLEGVHDAELEAIDAAVLVQLVAEWMGVKDTRAPSVSEAAYISRYTR